MAQKINKMLRMLAIGPRSTRCVGLISWYHGESGGKVEDPFFMICSLLSNKQNKPSDEFMLREDCIVYSLSQSYFLFT